MGELSRIVFRDHGVLIDFTGDGLMAMWGAPKPLDNHSDLAVGAALSILEALDELNNQGADRLNERFQLGVGINSGSAQVGVIGSSPKFKYGPVFRRYVSDDIECSMVRKQPRRPFVGAKPEMIVERIVVGVGFVLTFSALLLAPVKPSLLNSGIPGGVVDAKSAFIRHAAFTPERCRSGVMPCSATADIIALVFYVWKTFRERRNASRISRSLHSIFGHRVMCRMTVRYSGLHGQVGKAAECKTANEKRMQKRSEFIDVLIRWTSHDRYSEQKINSTR